MNCTTTCPRCGGRLLSGQDRYGTYRSCLTCGFVEEWCVGPAVQVEPIDGRTRREPVHEGLPL